MRSLPALLALVALFALKMPSMAQAQQATLPERKVGVVWEGNNPRINVSIADFLSPLVQQKLVSGLPQMIVLQAYGYEQNRKKAVSAYASSCRVVFDLWDEVYRIERQTPSQHSRFVVKYPRQVAALCLVLKGAAMKQVGSTAHNDGYVAFSVELNPLSDRSLERIRRWLVRPSGASGLGDDAFFGSFVRLFVNPRIGKADRVLRFRSQRLKAPQQ